MGRIGVGPGIRGDPTVNRTGMQALRLRAAPLPVLNAFIEALIHVKAQYDLRPPAALRSIGCLASFVEFDQAISILQAPQVCWELIGKTGAQRGGLARN